MFILFLASIFILYIWVLFPVVLFLCHQVLSTNREKSNLDTEQYFPSITVIIAAHNEASNLEKRILNIRQSDFDQELVSILIVSDGSTDNTVGLINRLRKDDPRLDLVDNSQNIGRADSHNIGMSIISSEIAVFTDAETEFDQPFLKELIRPFQTEKVGFVTGTLIYRNVNDTDLQRSVGVYWKLEQKLRIWETTIGLNIFGSGACCAVRRELYKPIPATGDVDFTTPIDVVKAGFQCVHAEKALAIDQLPKTTKGEFNARVRMTSKNFNGMFSRWGGRNIVKKPLYTLVIFSHKYGRWLTPYVLLSLLLSSIYLAFSSGNSAVILFLLLQIVFYTMSAMGYYKVANIGLLHTLGNFMLANVGFFVGILKVIKRDVHSSYSPISQSETNVSYKKVG